jgi:hypothetical protein
VGFQTPEQCGDVVDRKALWLIAALALIPGMGSGWIRPTTRAPCLPGIPMHDYLYVPASPPGLEVKQGMSFDGIELVEPSPKAAVPGKVKLRTFAMDKKAITIQHCSISQLAFTFGDDGRWILNCRADQNPWFTKELNSLPPSKLAAALKTETNHLLRNEFTVTVRCYGNFKLRETEKTTGKPALVIIQPPPFWVQRGVPFVGKFQNSEPGFTQYYALIDRVEFEFSYR